MLTLAEANPSQGEVAWAKPSITRVVVLIAWIQERCSCLVGDAGRNLGATHIESHATTVALHAQVSLHLVDGLTHRRLRIAVILGLIMRFGCALLPRASRNIGNLVLGQMQLTTNAVLR